MTRKNVYLDNTGNYANGSQKLLKKISSEMADDFGSASSQHAFGRKARHVVETARHQLARNN